MAGINGVNNSSEAAIFRVVQDGLAAGKDISAIKAEISATFGIDSKTVDTFFHSEQEIRTIARNRLHDILHYLSEHGPRLAFSPLSAVSATILKKIKE